MKKLKLNLDEIKVESFETKTENKETKGTVIAQQEESGGTSCWNASLCCNRTDPGWTCWYIGGNDNTGCY